MAGTRQTNTFGEALQKMLRDLADMKVMPDADLPFIVDLETQIIGKLRAPVDQQYQSGMSQAQPQPPMGMGDGGMGMGPGGPPGPPPGMAGAGANGLSTRPQMPNPDELRRMMAQQ